jgi:ABC-type phosphate/phosphonate transport system substrate-binding protein
MLAPAQVSAEDPDQQPFTLVVMDPLAGPLACDCVEGYAQRKYEVLGEFLEQHLGRDVEVVWSQALGLALEGEAMGRADLIIGKHSVVLADAVRADLKVVPVAQLTGKDGLTTQTGLIVVRKDDAAQSVDDLRGYRIFFGPADCDEKSAAPLALLAEHGIDVPAEPETCPACSDAATKLLELDADVRAAAVISSYAQPLLEGCGTIEKGDLRVVAESKTVPFITAFVNSQLDETTRQRVHDVLLEVQYDVNTMLALETKSGFVTWTEPSEDGDTVAATKKKN